MLKRSRSHRHRAGHTLVEVMVASVLWVMVTTSLMVSLLLSYRWAAETKYMNESRFALRSIADQFLMAPVDSNAPPGTSESLFAQTTAATGLGLAWKKDKNVFSFVPTGLTADQVENNFILGTEDGLEVPVGRAGNIVITREVTPLTASSTAGRLWRGDFVATFSLSGQTHRQAISVVRFDR